MKSFDRVWRKHCPELCIFRKVSEFYDMSTQLDENIRKTVDVETRLLYIQVLQRHHEKAAVELKYYKHLMNPLYPTTVRPSSSSSTSLKLYFCGICCASPVNSISSRDSKWKWLPSKAATVWGISAQDDKGYEVGTLNLTSESEMRWKYRVVYIEA